MPTRRRRLQRSMSQARQRLNTAGKHRIANRVSLAIGELQIWLPAFLDACQRDVELRSLVPDIQKAQTDLENSDIPSVVSFLRALIISMKTQPSDMTEQIKILENLVILFTGEKA